LKAQYDKEQFFQHQVLLNSSLLSRVRKENVVNFERRREMLTIEKTHRQSLQNLACDYKVIFTPTAILPQRSPKKKTVCFIYDNENDHTPMA
jgi:hypothetical protein